jgi:hypothetical protein
MLSKDRHQTATGPLTQLPETRGAIQALGQLGYTPQKLLQKFPNATAWAICARMDSLSASTMLIAFLMGMTKVTNGVSQRVPIFVEQLHCECGQKLCEGLS